MGCKQCACIGPGTIPRDEEDLEVIDMEESKERHRESCIQFEPPDIEKFRFSMNTSSSEQVKVQEERIQTGDWAKGDAEFDGGPDRKTARGKIFVARRG